MSIIDLKKHRIIKIKTINNGLFKLDIEKKNINFLPGDCIALYLKNGKSRPYSILSGINDPVLSFLIREIKNGEVSSQIKLLKPGNFIKISPPFGWFKPGQCNSNNKSIFFATGTGIAPFISYIKSFKDNPPAMLFYGVKKVNDAVGYNDFSISKKYLTISQEESEFHKGRITDLLFKIPIAENYKYYCCGREKMINEISLYLEKNNISKKQIHSEVFWHG